MTTTTITIPAFTDEQVAAALLNARPVDPEALRRERERATAALDWAFAHVRTEVQPWER